MEELHMGVEYMARQIYQDVIARVTRTEADWKADIPV